MAQILIYSEKALDLDGNVVTINHYKNSNDVVVGKVELLDLISSQSLEDQMRSQGFIPISELDLDNWE